MSLIKSIYGYDNENEFASELNQQRLYSFQIEPDEEDDNWADRAYQYRDEEDARLEEEQKQEELKRIKRREDLQSISTVDVDTGVSYAVYTPQTKEEKDEYVYHTEKQLDLIVDDSVVLNSARSFLRYGAHQIKKLVTDNEDPDGFDVQEQAKADGFSDEDINKHFDGIEHKIDYDYVKDGIQNERELNEYRALNPDVSSLASGCSFLFDAMALPAVAKPISAGTNILREGVTLAGDKALKVYDFCTSLTSKIPSSTLQHAANGAFIGTAFGYLDYKTHYEMEPEEAGKMACAGALLGGAGGLFLKDAPKFIKSVLDTVSEADKKTFVAIHEQTWKEPKPGVWKSVIKDDNINWITKAMSLLDKTPLLKSPMTVIQSSPSKSANRLGAELCDMLIPVEHLDNASKYLGSAELKVKTLTKSFNAEFAKVYKFCDKNKKELEELTGRTTGQLLDKIIQERGLPEEIYLLPEKTQQRFQKLLDVMNKTEERITQYALETRFSQIESRPVLTPEALEVLRNKTRRGEKITFADYEELERAGLIRKETHYSGKRVWDVDKVFAEESSRQEVLEDIRYSEGFINYTSAKEKIKLGEEAEANIQAKFNAYMASDAPNIEANAKLDTILDPTKHTGKFNDNVRERTILISSRETSKWHKLNTVETYISYIKHLTQRVALHDKLNKVAREFGVLDNIENIDELWKKVMFPELKKHLGDFGVKEHAKKIKELKENLELLCGVFDGSTRDGLKSSQILFGLQKYMYGSLLGMAPLSSLPDGVNIIHTYGLKHGYLDKMFNREFQVVMDDCIKSFSKKEMKEILNECAYGLDKDLYDYLLRCGSELFDWNNISYGNDKLRRFISGGNKWSQLTYKWSGMRAMDDFHIKVAQRQVLEDLKNHPERTGNTKAEIVKMMKTRDFSPEVDAYMYNQIASLTNKPRIHELQTLAYNPVGRLFFTFQSWVTAHTYNFVKPFLSSPYGHKIESLCWLVSMSGISTYLKSIVRGKPFDFSSEEGRNKFFASMYQNGLDELVGMYALVNDAVHVSHSVASRPTSSLASEIIRSRVPVVNWINNLGTSVLKSLNDMASIKNLLQSATPNWWWLQLPSNLI